MKTSALFAMCMAIATFLSAFSKTDTDFVHCRNYTAGWEKGISKTQMIEHDLTHAVWTTTPSTGAPSTLFFGERGQLQILKTDVRGHTSYYTESWKIIIADNRPVLVHSDQSREKYLYINQSCAGIHLTDMATKKTLLLDYQPIKIHLKLNFSQYLLGEWTNVSALEVSGDKKTIPNGYLNYQFKEDGNFSCQYGTLSKQITEEGSWEISKNGEFLLLHLANGETTENPAITTKVIRITQLDNHGLVLEQVMKTNEVNAFFGSTNKAFAFIK